MCCLCDQHDVCYSCDAGVAGATALLCQRHHFGGRCLNTQVGCERHLCVAGDIATKTDIIRKSLELLVDKFQHVFYVPGK